MLRKTMRLPALQHQLSLTLSQLLCPIGLGEYSFAALAIRHPSPFVLSIPTSKAFPHISAQACFPLRVHSLTRRPPRSVAS